MLLQNDKILLNLTYQIVILLLNFYDICLTSTISTEETNAFNQNNSNVNDLTRFSSNSKGGTLDVLYIVPNDLDNVFSLNEKATFGNYYSKGWLLPSGKQLTLDLYLYYEGLDQRRLNLFFNSPSDHYASNQSLVINQNNADSKENTNLHNPSSKITLYMFFTPETHCRDFMKRNSWAVEIREKIAPNTYKAQLNSIVLAYSSKPYYICMQQFDSDDDIHDSFRDYSHQGDDYWITIITTRDLMPSWTRIILFIGLLCLSGLFSGLNLGLMSLDLSELEILKRIGTPREQAFVTKIYPLRKRGNFLLCTILLGNVLVNSISTLILGEMLSGVYAAIGSTLLIVIFGEIIPQAACSKHGLAVGAYTRYITYLFMIITCPLSFPISIILDKILGKEISATYSREKIRELMKNIEDLGEKELKIISGALDFNKKKVREVMTSLDNVFMLEKNSKLDFETIAKIAQEGFSRIPIYESTRENVVGLLHVKDFTLLDPDDNMPVKALLEFYNHKVCFCDADRPIDEMFEEFRKGETHLAFVTEIIQPLDKDPYDLCVGIVTLEDILEELVQMEIYDEYDDKEQIQKELESEELSKKNNQKQSDYNSDDNLSTKSLSQHENLALLNLNNNMQNKRNDEYVPNSFHHLKNYSELESNEKQKSIDKNDSTAQTKSSLSSSSTKHNSSKTSTIRYETQTSNDLSFFLQQQKESTQRNLISPQIRFVMFQFLFTTVKPFTCEFLTKNVLELIFKRTMLKESRRLDQKSPCEYLYQYGKGCNYFILILSGEATIEVGKEKLEFPAGPFAYFGVNALLCGCENVDQVLSDDLLIQQHSPSSNSFNQNEETSNSQNMPASNSLKKLTYSKQYIPDFSLRVDDRCVYIKIDRDLWRNGVIKSRFEMQNNQISEALDYLPNEQGCNLNENVQITPPSPSGQNQSGSSNELLSVVAPPLTNSPSSLARQKPLLLTIQKHNERTKNRRTTITAVTALNKIQEVANAKLVASGKDVELSRSIPSNQHNSLLNKTNLETVNESGQSSINIYEATSSPTMSNSSLRPGSSLGQRNQDDLKSLSIDIPNNEFEDDDVHMKEKEPFLKSTNSLKHNSNIITQNKSDRNRTSSLNSND